MRVVRLWFEPRLEHCIQQRGPLVVFFECENLASGFRFGCILTEKSPTSIMSAINHKLTLGIRKRNTHTAKLPAAFYRCVSFRVDYFIHRPPAKSRARSRMTPCCLRASCCTSPPLERELTGTVKNCATKDERRTLIRCLYCAATTTGCWMVDTHEKGYFSVKPDYRAAA